ncbi:hypothetical protein EMCRGX_G005064 [Ephydatia muelleri]
MAWQSSRRRETKAALVERLYLHLQDTSSKPEPEREDVPDVLHPSPKIPFASALHWITATNYAADLIHYFDDFLLAGPPGQPTCSESTETMLRVCERLGIPLRLPPDKIQEMTLLIKSWLGKHKTTKRELLSQIGKLSFAANMVPSGHLLLHRLIELSTTVSMLHHHIHLNVEANEDIIWWNRFLPS